MKRQLSRDSSSEGDSKIIKEEIASIGKHMAFTATQIQNNPGTEKGYAQGPWTTDEGKLLEQAVELCGHVHWSKVSLYMAGRGVRRDATQCR
jgi:hypothetical protein